MPKPRIRPFHTVEQVAKDLQVSTRSVRRWIDNGELVVHRFGRAVRIADGDLQAFLVQRREG